MVTLSWLPLNGHEPPADDEMKQTDRLQRARVVALAVFCVAVLCLPHAVTAAVFITVEDECRGRQLLIQGPIEPGDHDRLAEQLGQLVSGDLPAVQDADKLWTVLLDSPGGDPAEAMRMGRYLRRALATTAVGYRFTQRPDGVYDFQRSPQTVCLEGDDRLAGCGQSLVAAECTGACLLVWLGGAVRHASEGRLGAHGLAGEESDAVRAYLQEVGVPSPWVSGLLDEPRSGDGWLSWAERRELGERADKVDDLLADCPPPLTSEESYQSVTADAAALRNRLLDQAAAHRECRRERLAAARAGLVAELDDTPH